MGHFDFCDCASALPPYLASHLHGIFELVTQIIEHQKDSKMEKNLTSHPTSLGGS